MHFPFIGLVDQWMMVCDNNHPFQIAALARLTTNIYFISGFLGQAEAVGSKEPFLRKRVVDIPPSP